jgi:hypothetical protein
MFCLLLGLAVCIHRPASEFGAVFWLFERVSRSNIGQHTRTAARIGSDSGFV